MTLNAEHGTNIALCPAAEFDQMGQGCTVCDHTAQTEKIYLLYLQCHLQSSAAEARNEKKKSHKFSTEHRVSEDRLFFKQ